MGKVANDVETEQIVYEGVPEGLPAQITSVVQNRGSIPLFWSQETSRLNLKPDIIGRPLYLLWFSDDAYILCIYADFSCIQCRRRTRLMKPPDFILKILSADMAIL